MMHSFPSILHKFILWIPAILLVFSWRSFFRVLVAKYFGDTIATDNGFATINPFVHVNPVNMLISAGVLLTIGSCMRGVGNSDILLPLFFINIGAWCLVDTPFTGIYTYKPKLGAIAFALAGFIGNLFLTLICFYCIVFISFLNLPRYALASFVQMFQVITQLSLYIGVLHLIPLPPFDCGKLLPYILPNNSHNFLEWIEEYSLIIFMLLFFTPGLSDTVMHFLSALVTYLQYFCAVIVTHTIPF